MPTLVIQAGHYGRTSGSTGGPGEAAAMIVIARAARDLVDATDTAWDAVVISADVPGEAYAGDAFVALHGDSSESKATVGASVGYRNPAGRSLAARWKTFYRAQVGHRIGPFRPDNYTANLAGYYGTRKAVAAGNDAAIIVEHGFMSNPDERTYIESSAGVVAAARAVCLAVTGALPDGSTLPDPEPDRWPVARGDTGALVTQVQSQLADLGYVLDVDGDFGPATEASVVAFQTHAGVPTGRVAGVWGEQTQAAYSTAKKEGHIMATITEVTDVLPGIVRDEISKAVPAIAAAVLKNTTRGSVVAARELNALQYLDLILRMTVKAVEQGSQARVASAKALSLLAAGTAVDLSDDDLAQLQDAIVAAAEATTTADLAATVADVLADRLED